MTSFSRAVAETASNAIEAKAGNKTRRIGNEDEGKGFMQWCRVVLPGD